jgi:pyruvate-formate lyase/AraC-like DNA-binding protein
MYEVLKYINENLCCKLTLDGISRQYGYSKWHFCDRFKQYTGITFSQYVRHRRMQMAALDVLKGRKLTDIALDYGYETQNGFNKSFLTEFGCLPTEFKYNERFYRNRYEERRLNMPQLTDRCEILKEAAVNDKPLSPFICAQRYYYFTKGLYNVPAQCRTNTALMAAGVASVAKNALPVIMEGELIVGYNYGDGEYEFLSDDPEKAQKQLSQGLFTQAEIDWYLTHAAEAKGFFSSVAPDEPLSAKDTALDQEMASMGFCLTSNHTVLGYEKVLKLGFEGLLAEVQSAATEQNKDFYDALTVLCDAGCALGERYAKKAGELILQCEDAGRREELEAIRTACLQVPRRPARNFREALQSLWFAHILNTWEDGINANSLGRLDQILYPYYKDDLAAGVLTKHEAFELICCLWIKLYRDYDVQQSCVGGCDEAGNSAVNELSTLMLDATEALNFVRCLSVRFSPQTDKEFIKRSLEVLGHVQKGVPFFFNDAVMIKALTEQGVSAADAAGYSQIGCVETVIPGKSNPHAVTGRCNLLKAIEYALGDGSSLFAPELRPGCETGDPARFTSYSLLEAAVYTQIRSLIESACRKVIRHIAPAAYNDPRPYKSLLTEGCLESGRDFNSQGAKYDYYQIMLLGIPNLADSLAAIRELVYAEKKYTLAELIHQLKLDFPDEAVRLDFVNKAPKFGNDIDEVDKLAVDIVNFSCECLAAETAKSGFHFHAQPFTFLWMVDHGRLTAATPDGRRKGEILAYSASPMQGRDFNGFTALMNSLAKLPGNKTAGTTSAIVEVDPKLFTDRNISFFADILLTAAEKGLCNVQFNIVDADTLIDAQKHPDKYKNLAVRVSGFSQKFYLLDRTMQDHIINRTKHKYM